MESSNRQAGHDQIFWDVDTQVDFMRESGSLYVPDAEGLRNSLSRLTQFAAERRIPIVASADDHELTDAEISLDPDFRSTFPPHCMRGTPGAARVPETQQGWTLEVGHDPIPRDRLETAAQAEQPRILILKKTVDVFSNPNTDAVLEVLDPGRVVVYGVALDICDRMTIEGLLARGRRVTLVTDAARPTDPTLSAQLLDDWRARGVELTTSGALTDSLES